MALGDVERVLLVEDDQVDQMNVRRAFEKSELDVDLEFAADGEEALSFLRGLDSLRGMLILLDLNMPRMDGIRMLEEVRSDDALHRLPVVVLTTSDAERDRVEAYDLNVAGYILKPVTAGSFKEIVERLADYWEINRLP